MIYFIINKRLTLFVKLIGGITMFDGLGIKGLYSFVLKMDDSE